MGTATVILEVFITLLFPPLGVFLIAGCGADLLINILLTCLGYIPGHIHAFYLEYMYYHNKELALSGRPTERAPGVFSGRVKSGGPSAYHKNAAPPGRGGGGGYGGEKAGKGYGEGGQVYGGGPAYSQQGGVVGQQGVGQGYQGNPAQVGGYGTGAGQGGY